MKIKFSTLTIPSNLIPHTEDEIDQTKELASYIFESLSVLDYKDVEIDDKILLISSIFGSKLLEGVIDNSYSYYYSLKGAKYLSGDASILISETLTYATLYSLYNVNFNNIIPFRTVKYLGVIADSVVDLSKEKKLAEELNTSSGLLFINIRASMSPRSYYVIDKLWKSLMNIEIVRYPDNYGLISLIIKEGESMKETFIFITPG